MILEHHKTKKEIFHSKFLTEITLFNLSKHGKKLPDCLRGRSFRDIAQMHLIVPVCKNGFYWHIEHFVWGLELDFAVFWKEFDEKDLRETSIRLQKIFYCENRMES